MIVPSGDPSRLVGGLGAIPIAPERDAQPRRRQVYVQVSRWRQNDDAVVVTVTPERNVCERIKPQQYS